MQIRFVKRTGKRICGYQSRSAVGTVPDGCPMFAPAYMGRKRLFQMLSLRCTTILALGRRLAPQALYHQPRAGCPISRSFFARCGIPLLSTGSFVLSLGTFRPQPESEPWALAPVQPNKINTTESTNPLIWTALAELSPGRSPG